jgi:phosphoglycerate dehydrogenase-like enzyme
MRTLIAATLLAAATLSAQAQPAQTLKIVALGFGPDDIRGFQAMSPKVRIVSVDNATVMTEIVDADAFFGVITPQMYAAAKQLKWVATMSAGVENILRVPGAEPFRSSNVILTNNKEVQGIEIADHAFALLLYNTRHLYEYEQYKAKEEYSRTPFKGIELRGKTALIIGVGGIGTNIALRAWAFGMHVIGVDPEDKPIVPYIDRIVKPDQLDEVVPLADVVFISAPDTDKSHKMFGGRQFDMMKQNSYFIAVSRGGVYDMPGLVRALDSRKIAGAGVDVMDPEPLPPGHALWKFPNVMITPHVAGRSDHDNERMLGTIKDNIRRFAEGMPLINVVDKQKGY